MQINTSASATLAVADGPFIFGDILAALGLAWTGYDLLSMQDEFRTAVDASINESLQASASEITGKVTSAGLFLSSTYESRRIETGSNALKRLMTPS